MIAKRRKHISKIVRFTMTVLTSLLIVLILIIILMVSRIQGTARVVNYAGLVRGKTQRIIKLEDAGMPQEEMIADVDEYIKGLRFGSDELNLVSLDDKAFQMKMKELDTYYDSLKQEIYLVRQVGYANTNIIQKSEIFFNLCDVATGLAESYAQRIATRLKQFEVLTVIKRLKKSIRKGWLNAWLDEKTETVYLTAEDYRAAQERPEPFTFLIRLPIIWIISK